MIPELHRPLPLERIGATGMDFVVEASPAELAALAPRLLLPAVHRLTCRMHLVRDGVIVMVHGHLSARIVQTCVVSLEEFESAVEEDFQVRFVPDGDESDDDDPDSIDEIPYINRTLDLGEAATEQLALSLDPYPRMPNAEMPETEAEPEPHPFAALEALRRKS